MSVVTTQDVSFGACWVRLIGDRAGWEPNSTSAPLDDKPEETPSFGVSLVSVWVSGDGPVLVCRPKAGLKALKDFEKGTEVEVLRQALRDGDAVVREYDGQAPRVG